MRDSQTSIQPVHLSRFTALALFLLVFAWHNNLQAASNEDSYPRNYELGIEYFQWEEFDSTGKRLLSEHGPRAFLGFTSQDILPAHDYVYATAQAKLYAGSVNYDGQTQVTIGGAVIPSLSGIYFPSTSRYTGWNLELLSGWGAFPKNSGISIIGALGAEGWQRDIANSTDARGNPISGAQEDYKIIYARLGLGFEKSHKHWRYSAKAGLKRPLWTEEQVNGLNLTLEPGKQWSLFASYQLGLKTESEKEYFITTYFDSYRFSTSPVVDGFLQPESQLDTFGVSFGSSF